MDKTVIGLMGVKESGKSTVAKILAEDHGFAILEPGMQVMELLLDINPIVQSDRTVQQVFDSVGYLGFKKLPEGRRLLQELGTRIRERDPYFWVTQQMRAIEATEGNIVHTSVRFPNEARLVKGWEGHVWLVERDVEDIDGHASERAWREIPADLVVPNNGTLSELRSTVSDALAALG